MSNSKQHITAFRDALKRGAANSVRCLYPDCKEKSINSHSISKKISLTHVAESSKLITREFRRNDTKKWLALDFKPEGIHRATTFKGFCKKHDDLFASVDQSGIVTFRDLFLQIYRSTSKLLLDSEILKKTRNEFYPESKLENGFYTKMSVNSELINNLSFDLLFDFPDSFKCLPYEGGNVLILKPFTKKHPNPEYLIITKKIPTKIPVARQNLKTYNLNENYSELLTIIIPGDKETVFIIVCHDDFSDKIRGKLSSLIKCLEFSESSLVIDSSFFLSPSIIVGMSEEKRKVIEGDLWFFQEFVDKNYDISIFDDVRRQIALELPKEQKEMELEKIRFIPQRAHHDERIKKFEEKTGNDTWLRMGFSV